MRRLLILPIFLLTGCGLFQKEVKVIEKPVYVEPERIPNELLIPCTVSKPIAISDYMDMTLVSRNIYLTKYVNDLLTDIGLCTKRIEDIQEWQNKQIKNYQKHFSNKEQ